MNATHPTPWPTPQAQLDEILTIEALHEHILERVNQLAYRPVQMAPVLLAQRATVEAMGWRGLGDEERAGWADEEARLQRCRDGMPRRWKDEEGVY